MVAVKESKKRYKNPKINPIYIEKYNIYILIENSSNPDEQKIKENRQENIESLVKEIAKIQEQKNQKIISLENKIKSLDSESNSFLYPNYNSLEDKTNPTYRDEKSGANVFYVSPSALPQHVLGMYVPSEHTIYIANNLLDHEEKFVYHHEVAHALGIIDESLADAYASSKVGYNLRAA